MQRQKAYSAINIVGVLMGRRCWILVFLFAHAESTLSTVAATEIPAKNSRIQLAITIDDLPWVGALRDSDSAGQALERIAAVLRVHDAPATGFVVCDHAIQNEQALQTWVSWGFSIGNHSAAHRLERALADPVYSRPDEYIGPKGLSWLYRMQPLSTADVQWDDAEADTIEKRFSRALATDAKGVSASRVTSQYVSPRAPTGFAAVFAEAGESERMRSLLVMHKGERVAEAYFNGASPETPVNLKSVTKSLTSALMGIALRKGWIESVNDSIGHYLPESKMINHNTLHVRGYGYLWWLLEVNGEAAYAALGHGGQILLVSPQRELVVLMTSRWPSASSTAHYRHLTRILVDRVLTYFPRKG